MRQELGQPRHGAEFIGWSGACAGVGTCVVDATNNVAVGATFAEARRTLTVSASGGGAYAVT
ncbi:MAG: hypothetical protein IPQ07_40690 [Myxococcales bacterium]|nr:hypothetical protein [Myxococcales bacterium]